MIASVRQLMYPEEFRIAPYEWPPELLSVFEKLMTLPENTLESPNIMKENLSFFADVCTGLWRLRQKMLQMGTDRPLEEMRRAYRHLQSVWDALIQAGFEIQEHTGKLFDSGLSLKVIAFQPTPGIGREKVIETIKPSIYYKNESIQMGEVIVGTPEKTEEKLESTHQS